MGAFGERRTSEAGHAGGVHGYRFAHIHSIHLELNGSHRCRRDETKGPCLLRAGLQHLDIDLRHCWEGDAVAVHGIEVGCRQEGDGLGRRYDHSARDDRDIVII